MGTSITDKLAHALGAILDATGGDPPDWLRAELVAAESAIAEYRARRAAPPSSGTRAVLDRAAASLSAVAEDSDDTALVADLRTEITTVESMAEALEGVDEWISNHVPECEGRGFHHITVRVALALYHGKPQA